MTAPSPEDEARVMNGQTYPALRLPNGKVFVAPYHYQAWEMAYPDLDEILDSGKLPEGAVEGFVMDRQFRPRPVTKGPRQP